MENNMPKYLPGFEPEEIADLLKSFFQQIDKSFPDMVIVWSEWNHTELDETAKYFCDYLGYKDVRDFLQAYGYRIVLIKPSNNSLDNKQSEKQNADKTTKRSEKQNKQKNRKRSGRALYIGIIVSLFIIVALVLLLKDGIAESQTVIYEDSNGHPFEFDFPQYDAEAHANDFNKFNILTFEEVPNSKEYIFSQKYITCQWKVKNNSDWVLPRVSGTVCYYDDEGNIIDSRECSLNYSLEPGKTAIMDFISDTDYDSCDITLYTYFIPRNYGVFSGDTNCVDVDLISESVTFWATYVN